MWHRARRDGGQTADGSMALPLCAVKGRRVCGVGMGNVRDGNCSDDDDGKMKGHRYPRLTGRLERIIISSFSGRHGQRFLKTKNDKNGLLSDGCDVQCMTSSIAANQSISQSPGFRVLVKLPGTPQPHSTALQRYNYRSVESTCRYIVGLMA